MILHADLNSFFARVEQQARRDLRDRPIGILGKNHKGARTCICAASPEAKRYGVYSGSSVWQARQTCPDTIFVPPDYPKYLDVSRRFIEILHRVSPRVEIFSIDEAFVDIHGDVQNAIRAANFIKQCLRNQLGELITVSIGIAWGKTFAKLASDLVKPDGLVVLEKGTWPSKFGSLSVDNICGIGPKLAGHLATLQIRTLWELAQADAAFLVARFGPATGIRLWQIGQGIDTAPVISSDKLAAPKSIGHQTTLDQDCQLRALGPIVKTLATRVGRRMRRSGQRAGQLILNVELASGGYQMNRLRVRPAIVDDFDLKRSSLSLLENLPVPPLASIRQVSLTATGLTPNFAQRLPLFSEKIREEWISVVLDQLRDQYGDQSIMWADQVSRGSQPELLRDWRGPGAILGR